MTVETQLDLLRHDLGSGLANEMHAMISELYPICRSITGNGFRQSMKIIQEHVPLQLHEVATGTPAFDWTVPKEWNVRDAYVKKEGGNRVINFKENKKRSFYLERFL